MGGLVTRYFMQNGPPVYQPYLLQNPVHNLVTIGTPHLGTALATVLATNQGNQVGGPGTNQFAAKQISDICSQRKIKSCTLGNFFASMQKVIDGAVTSLESGLGRDNTQYSSIVGLKPEWPISTTEGSLNLIIHGFVSGSQSIDGYLGTMLSDTIVNENSQIGYAFPATAINGIVHEVVCPVWFQLCLDSGETGNSSVFSQAEYWLMGGSGPPPLRSSSSTLLGGASARTIRGLDPTSGAPPPILELDGYTEVSAANVSFSPTSGSALTINSPTTITATSSTKTITEILLFQAISDPTDGALLYSTQSPFNIIFIPTRLGSTSLVAFAVFSDMTYAVAGLNYTFQLPGSPLSLNLVNAPVASMPLGTSVLMSAQGLFSNGPVDVSQASSYGARSGTSKVFSVDSGGLVTANGSGVDWLDVSYNGLSVSAQIMVGQCTYSLSPKNQTVDVGGGSPSVALTTTTGGALGQLTMAEPPG
jgi:hypothetical protein